MIKAKKLFSILLCILCLFSLPVASYAEGNYESGFSDGRKAAFEELLKEITYDIKDVNDAFYSGVISGEDILYLYCNLVSSIEAKYSGDDLLNILSLGDSSAGGQYARGLADVQNDNTSVPTGTKYILNTNTKKFHEPSCSSVDDMKESNKAEYIGTRSEVIGNGYDPCGRCKP